jgi:opacity protein-like surface antigen
MRFISIAVSLFIVSASVGQAQVGTWTGAYGGITKAANSGTDVYSGGEFDGLSWDIDGQPFGVFAGYLWNRENMIYGAETAVTLGKVYEEGQEEYFQFDRFVDMKARLGSIAGNALVYGTLGVSRARFNAFIGSEREVSTNALGMVYGIGVEYKFAARYFIGAEYLRRSYSFYEAAQAADIDAKINSVTLRIGMQF